MKIEQQENGEGDVKDFIRNGESQKPPDVAPDENLELQEVILILKEAKDLLNAYSAEINRRLQEPWSIEQAGDIIKRVDNAQEKLDNYIRKEATTAKKIVEVPNPKQEVVEVTDLDDEKNKLLPKGPLVEGGIKLEVNEVAIHEEAELKYLEQLAFDLDPSGGDMDMYDVDQYYETDELDDKTWVPSKRDPSAKKELSGPAGGVDVECKICGVTVKSGGLQKHYKSHGDGPYPCFVCQREFEDIHTLARHYRKHPSVKEKEEPTVKGVECLICEEVVYCTTKGHIELKHHYKIHGDGPFACPTCELELPNLQKLREHSKSHKKHPWKERICVICNESYPSLRAMVAHRNTHGDGPFTCRICQKEYKNLKKIIQHMTDHGNEVTCEVCSKSMSEKKLKHHMGYHTGENMETCSVCFKSHPKAFMNIHMKMKHQKGNRRYYCHMCSKSYASKKDLNAHMRYHTGENANPCNLCERIFARPNELRRHLFKIHQVRDESGFECEHCDKAFFHKNELKNHMQIHTGEKPHQCEECGKSFRKASSKNQHMRIHTGERPYACDQCGQTFVQRAHMLTHIKLVHEGKKLAYNQNQTPAMCGVCGKTFTNKRGLKIHEVVHTGEKPFKCELCDGKFAFVSNLNSHVKMHHSIEEDEKLTCDQCGKEYKNKVSLRVHKKNTHGRKVINGKEEKVPCTICNAEFTRKGNMLKHVRDVHEGIKNFKCEICSRAFSSITMLTQHSRVHTGEKPYSCEVCNKAFSQKSSLYSHKKKSCS